MWMSYVEAPRVYNKAPMSWYLQCQKGIHSPCWELKINHGARGRQNHHHGLDRDHSHSPWPAADVLQEVHKGIIWGEQEADYITMQCYLYIHLALFRWWGSVVHLHGSHLARGNASGCKFNRLKKTAWNASWKTTWNITRDFLYWENNKNQ